MKTTRAIPGRAPMKTTRAIPVIHRMRFLRYHVGIKSL
jgi:hypothetical protein